MKRRTRPDLAQLNILRAGPLEERFWRKVKRGEENECWEWEGCTILLSSGRYGRINIGGRLRPAHRIAYELAVGPIPEGLTIDHLCRNTLCVNPEHLEPVTLVENVMRGNSFSATNKRKTHCLHGHPFDAANTYLVSKRRQCRTCNNVRNRAFYDAKHRSRAQIPLELLKDWMKKSVVTLEQRARLLCRCLGRCEECHMPPDWRGLSVSHEIAKGMGGTTRKYPDEALKMLCGRCHSARHHIKEGL